MPANCQRLGLVVVTLLFALIFKYLPDAKIAWKDVWIGAGLTTLLFLDSVVHF